jgi:SNF2 family DNA or RNA helicase
VCPFDGLLIDESQNFNAPDSKQGAAARLLAERMRLVVLASGTPTPNGAQDAWAPGRMIAPGNAFWTKQFGQWRTAHFQQVATYSWRPKAGAAKTINAELEKNALSIRLQDTTDVPAAVFANHPFVHDDACIAAMQSLQRDGSFKVGGRLIEVKDDAGYLATLRQLTNGFVYVDEQPVVLSMARTQALKELVESVEGPVLCGVHYKADVEMIRRVFPKAVTFTGATPEKDRQRIVSDWNADRIPLLLAHPIAAGKGLNLQFGSAATVAWYSHPFSWADRQQLNARLIRSGQSKRISVLSLVSTVGVDEAILGVLDRKETGERALMAALDVMKKRGVAA